RTSAYVLTLARTPSLRDATSGNSICQWTASTTGLRRRECRNITMDEFARQLPNTGGIGIFLPVKNETGLNGHYDFEFEVGDLPNRNPAGQDSPSPPDDSGPGIFSALAKLGLRLEERKMMVPAIAIDHLDRPQ
ncbi:MAG TPA: TIGR03435 family protein, partial [Acidobacteriaceae bacterium]